MSNGIYEALKNQTRYPTQEMIDDDCRERYGFAQGDQVRTKDGRQGEARSFWHDSGVLRVLVAVTSDSRGWEWYPVADVTLHGKR